MKIILLQTGRTAEKYLNEGIAEYSTRIGKYNPFDIITLPDIKSTRNMPVAEQKKKEGTRILESLSSDDHVVLLDERGKEMSTLEFSKMLERTFQLSKKRIVFIIGGPYGFSDEVYARADSKLSLSKLTFSHQMVRLLFLEQLYRAFTVIKGDPYHHQ